MSQRLSLSMANALLGGVTNAGALRGIVNGNFKLYLYKGTVPATASAAIGTATLCGTAANAGAAVNLAAAASGGTIAKLASETWGGNYVSTGTLTFYRFMRSDDDGAIDTGDGVRPRIQGVINSGNAEMLIGNPAVTSGDPFTINTFTQSLLAS